MLVLLMAVLGITVLLAGRLQVSRTRVIYGNRALLAGVVLISPLPAMHLANMLVSALANPALLKLSAAQATTINDAVALSMTILPILLVAHFALAAPKSDYTPADADDEPQTPAAADFGTLEASMYLGISEDALMELIRSGAIISHKINGKYRISAGAMQHYLKYGPPRQSRALGTA